MQVSYIVIFLKARRLEAITAPLIAALVLVCIDSLNMLIRLSTLLIRGQSADQVANIGGLGLLCD